MSDAWDRVPFRLSQWRREIDGAATAFQLDPLLLAAIVDRESLGGVALRPQGPAGKGDKGNGHGLGQIDGRFHHEFIAAKTSNGTPLWQLPSFNLMYAAWLLRQNLSIFNGEVAAAVAAYNAGPANVRKQLMALSPDASNDERLAAVDAVTTGRNYARDVLGRREVYTAGPPA